MKVASFTSNSQGDSSSWWDYCDAEEKVYIYRIHLFIIPIIFMININNCFLLH